jgi:hypothetical protein
MQINGCNRLHFIWRAVFWQAVTQLSITGISRVRHNSSFLLIRVLVKWPLQGLIHQTLSMLSLVLAHLIGKRLAAIKLAIFSNAIQPVEGRLDHRDIPLMAMLMLARML